MVALKVTGAVVERDSFDAWGQRRTPLGEDDWAYPGQSITSEITRGYTGHEQLDSVGLVHMNGRIYEPVISYRGAPAAAAIGKLGIGWRAPLALAEATP
jgi:hypothetical protein